MITIIFDDDDRLLLRPPAGAREAVDRLDVPAAGRDALPGPRRHGRGPDLLVHRRGGRQGPRASCGRSRTGTSATSSTASRAWPRSPASAAPRASTRSTSTRTSSGPTASASARSTRRSPGRTRRSAAGSIHKGNAEYLIRSVGWIEDLDDIENTVVAQRGRHADLRQARSATVQLGPAFRRSVLEKDGKEVVGGVVLMRYGENPLEVTRRIKEKIRTLQAGPARGRADRPVLRPHAADPQGASRPSAARSRRS